MRTTNVERINFDTVLMDHVSQSVMMVDANRKICFWNRASEKLYGWTKEEVLGRNVVDISIEDSSREEAESILKKLINGESWSTELAAKRKDGSFFAVIVNRTPIFDDEGVYVGATIVATDITEQKQTERDMMMALEFLSSSLDKIEELNEKLKVVGSLTRHDVRNKLSAVTGYSYILKKKHFDLADVVEGLDKMSHAVSESMMIFDFAKVYEQLGVEELVDVDVAKAVDEAAAMFSGLPFKVVNNCHGLTVRADSLLRQLIYNFIDNTWKYGITTKAARVYYEKTASGDLQLIYEDDGVGIPKENKEQLFKQGFSTGNSTGFGLFLSKKMIEVYGWTITEEGKHGEGAKFVIVIPLKQ
ncbi:MAG: PAS domain S-box protein [Thermoproteota archaeon]|nr:PAS domain S-box protein [Thermoproteota archaeon]